MRALHVHPAVCLLGAVRGESSTAAAAAAKLGKDNKKKQKGDQKENKYSHTLNLPVTEFNQRANSQSREPELQKVSKALCYAAYAMLCYAVLPMLCCAMLCYAMLCCLCYAVLCCAMLCYAMLCCAVLCYTML
jgi:hypothetical protein